MRRISVLTFVALWVAAMAAYPGWNAFDPDSVGHDFGALAINVIPPLLALGAHTQPDGTLTICVPR